MKLTFILITILINFCNPLFIKSEENSRSINTKRENSDKEQSFNSKNTVSQKIHIVKAGDTLSSISKFYSIDKNLIIKLNDLKDENYIYVGQNLLIDSSNLNSSETSNSNIKESHKYHIVQLGENLTEISFQHKLKLEYLIEINHLKNPDSIKVGDKLLLTKNISEHLEKESEIKNKTINKLINKNKKTYGPLTIQSDRLEKINGREVLHVTNQNGQKFILSIRCKTKELDVRIPYRKWSGWEPAKKEFEINLIKDLCKNFN